MDTDKTQDTVCHPICVASQNGWNGGGGGQTVSNMGKSDGFFWP